MMRVRALVRNQVCDPVWIRGRVTGGKKCIPGKQKGEPGEGVDFRSKDEVYRHLIQMRGYTWEVLKIEEITE